MAECPLDRFADRGDRGAAMPVQRSVGKMEIVGNAFDDFPFRVDRFDDLAEERIVRTKRRIDDRQQRFVPVVRPHRITELRRERIVVQGARRVKLAKKLTDLRMTRR
ncbi:MAG TPA: hypothetical protein VGX96_13525 [Candidatus Elarobacter sp.]|nr:hypothetical protein [Candidatus Elarobacter sp.]